LPTGTKVNCGVHNHSDNIFEEIHVCLSPGTGNGGMSRLKDEYNNTPEDQLDLLPEDAFDHLALKRLEEHGGMWYRDSYGDAICGYDNVVAYPWHKWQAGDDAHVDVWVAFEFNPDLDPSKKPGV
jgi:hypothetical protein